MAQDCNEQYPEKEFLEMMLEAEIPISINSDAHSPIDVGMNFEKAAKLAYEIGYNKTVRFNKDKEQRFLSPFSLHMILRIREKTLDFSNRTMVMGIININDDSFSGDGTLDQYKAIQMALEKVDQGADIIDVGAETRTNRGPITINEEVDRLIPFIDAYLF